MIAVGRDWKSKRARRMAEIAALKADLNKGLADLAEGRVKDFEVLSEAAGEPKGRNPGKLGEGKVARPQQPKEVARSWPTKRWLS